MKLPFDPRLLDDETLAALARMLDDLERYDWRARARPEQLMPARPKELGSGLLIWLVMAGRGFGKTRAGAEAVREACSKPNQKAAVIARTYRDLRLINFEGRASGFMSLIPPDQIAEYNRSGPGILLTNGSSITGYSSGDPDTIRGQEFDMIWGDEYAAWHVNTAQDMFDQAALTLRESPDPRIILTTTPKRVQHVVSLVRQWEKNENGLFITKGRMMDNAANLNAAFVASEQRRIGGTRLGRQELDGELLEDVENALWTFEMIQGAVWDGDEAEDKFERDPNVLPAFRRVITAVDPSGSTDGDATGIVTVGYDRPGRIFVLDDDSLNGTPEQRYAAACRAAHRWGASKIVYESNYGGDNIAMGLRASWKELLRTGAVDGACPTIEPSTAKKDKALRAEPVVAMYERQLISADAPRIYHAGGPEGRLAKLENEQLTWEPEAGWSPNRLDALVHGVLACLRELGREASVSRAPRNRRIGGDGWRP